MSILKKLFANLTLSKVFILLAGALFSFCITVYASNVHILSPIYLPFIFVGAFAIQGIILYVIDQIFKSVPSPQVILVSVAVAILIMVVGRDVFFPTHQETYISLTAETAGEICLCDVVVDGENIPVAEVYVVENSGWLYREEWDNFVIWPEEDGVENRLTLRFVANEVHLGFPYTHYAGSVTIASSVGKGGGTWDLRCSEWKEGKAVQYADISLDCRRDYSLLEFIWYGIGILPLLGFICLIPFYAFNLAWKKGLLRTGLLMVNEKLKFIMSKDGKVCCSMRGGDMSIKVYYRYFYFPALIVLTVAVLAFSWLQLQISCIHRNWAEFSEITFGYAVLGIVTNLAFLSIIWIVANSLWKACFIFCGLTFVLSVVNHYTIQLHNVPLTLTELGNWRTAANVLGSYQLEFRGIVPLVIIFAVQAFLIFCIKCLTKKSERNLRRRVAIDASLALLSIFVLYFGYFSPSAIMSESIGANWVRAYQRYSYIACALQNAWKVFNKIKMPYGYTDDCLAGLEIVQKTEPVEDPPDIILILNETFFDLSILTHLETDVPYLENIQTMENTIQGYALNPAGGTNSSEYELLTSNSLKLLDYSPFNFLSLQNANSIVSHMKRLGYTTTGAHCATAVNYHRASAYPALGFDHIYFEDDFINKTYYGDRIQATDDCCYENLLSWYKKGNGPQFLYLLTIQNHGGWNQNKEELDTVHVLGDFGEITKQMNEYLSCIRLTDQAFQDFTEQLQEIDRKIIVCMVGDHAPSFYNQLPENTTGNIHLLCVSTPFVIWANYDLEDTVSLEGRSISMSYLVPSLLQLAGVRLSPYYQHLIDIRDEVPILMSWDLYFDKNGGEHTYEETCEYSEAVNTYLYMEYNNLQKDREQVLFDPYPVYESVK